MFEGAGLKATISDIRHTLYVCKLKSRVWYCLHHKPPEIQKNDVYLWIQKWLSPSLRNTVTTCGEMAWSALPWLIFTDSALTGMFCLHEWISADCVGHAWHCTAWRSSKDIYYESQVFIKQKIHEWNTQTRKSAQSNWPPPCLTL